MKLVVFDLCLPEHQLMLKGFGADAALIIIREPLSEHFIMTCQF